MTGAAINDLLDLEPAPSMAALRGVLADLDGEVLALGGKRGHRAASLIHHLAFGKSVTDDEITAALATERVAARPDYKPGSSGKSVAILTAYGIATQKFELQPWAFSTALLARNVTALASDSAVEAIQIWFDTPGGQVTGTIEAADAIWNARKRKPVIGAVDSLAASAGFWLSSQCSHLICIGETASVGAIGCFLLHIDASRAYDAAGITPLLISNEQSPHKTAGNPFEPASESFKKFEQREVNEIGSKFINAVARGRGVAAAEVETKFGQGRVFRAPDARRLGMIDSIGDVNAAMRMAMASSKSALRSAQLAEAKRRAGIVSETERHRLRRRLAELRANAR